jgi:signal transduction histidine kinase
MRDSSGILFILFSIFVVLIALFALVVSLPRILKKKEKEKEYSELNTVMGAFNVLGSEIKSLKEQLIIKERLAALGEVSAGIAHEFRNPMGVIAGYAKLLLKSFDEHDDRRDSAQGILNEIEEMNTVMEELLKFSKSAPLHKTNIDASGLLSSVLKSTGDDEARITVSCDEKIMLQGDETTLRQALKNLVHNALDAGDRVSVHVEKGSLSGRKGVFIFVKDNGKGIPATDMQKIFQPFYTTKEKGTGIGLALVQKIAMAHEGSVNAKSTEGEGSTFNLFLPEETL